MRLILTNFGTTGDVHPYIALAKELKAHGHQAILACSPNFEELVNKHGLEFLPLGPDLLKIQYDINTALIESPDIQESAEPLHALFSQLTTALPQMLQEVRDISRGADALISGPMQPAARMVHELTGIPFVSVQVEHFGGGGTPAFQQASAGLINPFRAQHGLAPLADPLTSDANSPQLALYAMSRHVSPPPDTWPAHHHMTGYFFLDDEEWQPEASLREFVEGGESPVVVTFGSMPHEDPREVTRLIVGAVERVGRRAVIQHGWSGLAAESLPPLLHAVGYVYYPWLFARAACVVHHGGPGTAAAVFRAGVPNIFVPHAWDQPIWAELAEGLGVAGPSISYAELSEQRLADSIRQTLECGEYARAARVLGEKIRGEQGVSRARQMIERLVRSVGLYEEASVGEEEQVRAAQATEEEEGRMAKVTRRKSYQHRLRSRKVDQAVSH
jgi:UDP:flavonoid glycosyltransferase YjiC (YdhE family)